MLIFCYQISSMGYYCTINELIVIRILLNKIKLVEWLNFQRIWIINDGINNISCYFLIGKPVQYFLIFLKYLCRYTQRISSIKKRVVYFAVATFGRDNLNKCIGINNDSTHLNQID